MSRPRSSKLTLALALLCVICLLPLLLPSAAQAKTIYVLGTGGIYPTCICPVCTTTVCAVITEDSQGALNVLAVDPVTYDEYDVELNTAIPAGVTEIQGSQLDIESVTPRE